MGTKSIVVVGNAFEEYARKCNGITLQDLQATDRLSGYDFILGQGLSSEQTASVAQTLQACGAAPIMDQTALPAGNHSSHKKHYNTMIGIPAQRSKATYEAPMFIDERCELMSDHQSGLHIQGMLQLEAFRQMVLAVFEQFYPRPQDQGSYAVINRMENGFSNFMFPLPASIVAHVTDVDTTERRTRLAVEMRALQNDLECSQCTAEFTFYPASIIAKKEAVLAAKATSAAFRLSATDKIYVSPPTP